MTGYLWRAMVVTHRYLGVAVGVLMVIWFASGAVMMYVGFPHFPEQERLRVLPLIAWPACCRIADGVIADTQQFSRVQIESLLDRPVLRLSRSSLPDLLVDLSNGAIRKIDNATAREVAVDFVSRLPSRKGPLIAAEEVESDQWTIGGRYRFEQPLLRFTFDDGDRSIVYVSGASGQVLLRTTGAQRFWNWLGAVPHWIYLTALRSDVQLWSQVVIWASILGTFLTIVGICLGIAQCGQSDPHQLSPYRGLFYWHHMAGLAFGVVTLTFVVSGLISMNPWGFLETRGAGEQLRLEGAPPRWSEIKTSINAIPGRGVPAVSLTAAPLAGRLYWLATDAAGTVTRLDATGEIAPVSDADLSGAAQRLAGESEISEQGILREEDAYYFGHHDEVVLPVYRVVVNDANRTRYYLDPVSAALLQTTDANRRWHRWLFAGLHRLDFFAWLRVRPIWDIVVLALLLGGLGVSATGVYLAIRRVQRDVGSVLRRIANVKRKHAARSASLR